MSDDIRPLLRNKIQQLRDQIAAIELTLEAIDGISPVAAPKFAAKAEALAKTKNGKRQKSGYHNRVDRGILRARIREIIEPGETIGPKEFTRRVRKAGMQYQSMNSQLSQLRAQGVIVGIGKPRNMVYQLAEANDPNQTKFTLDN